MQPQTMAKLPLLACLLFDLYLSVQLAGLLGPICPSMPTMIWTLLSLLLQSTYHYYCLQSNGYCINTCEPRTCSRRKLKEIKTKLDTKLDETNAALAEKQQWSDKIPDEPHDF